MSYEVTLKEVGMLRLEKGRQGGGRLGSGTGGTGQSFKFLKTAIPWKVT